MDLDRIEQVALEAQREGGRVLRHHFRRLTHVGVKNEDFGNLITIADHESEAAILSVIREHFPDHAALAEESGASGQGADSAETRWIIDPLDGTTNYSHGLPIYSISIAVEHRGEVVLGSVFIPEFDELFLARRGGGATRNGEPIHVSANDTLKRSFLVTGFPYDRRDRADRYLGFWKAFMMTSQDIRRLGSAAVDLAYVAMGIFDGYYEESLNPWDWSAGALLVSEAGGRVTDYEGRPFRNSFSQCLASNGLIHEEMLKILNHPVAP
jgi:myo-inositol-1(or 4)-monophosphatase